jgi:hypothetical protein
MISPTPYFAAAKKAGMPSTIGDEPRIGREPGKDRVGSRREMVVPMAMGGGTAMPMDVDVAGQQRSVAAQRGVEPVVRWRQLMLVRKWDVVRVGVPMMMAVPVDRIVRMAVTMPLFGRRIQLAPGRKRDPAAEPDQGDAGSRID